MAESQIVKNMRSGLIQIIAGANSYDVKFEEGNFSLTIPGRSVAVYRDRGRFADADHGQPMALYDQDQEMTGTFTAYMRDISDGSFITGPQFITKSGLYASSWGTTMTGAGTEAPKLVDIKWTVYGVIHGDPADHTILCQWCNITGGLADGGPNTVSFSFSSFDVYPTVT